MTEDALFRLGETLDAAVANYATQAFGDVGSMAGGHPVVTFMIFVLASMVTIARCCRTAQA